MVNFGPVVCEVVSNEINIKNIIRTLDMISLVELV